jgi:hypothetical protein
MAACDQGQATNQARVCEGRLRFNGVLAFTNMHGENIARSAIHDAIGCGAQ